MGRGYQEASVGGGGFGGWLGGGLGVSPLKALFWCVQDQVSIWSDSLRIFGVKLQKSESDRRGKGEIGWRQDQ